MKNKIIQFIFRIKGKRECINYSGDSSKASILQLLENHIVRYVEIILSQYTISSNSYNITSITTMDYVFGKLNERINEIQTIFQTQNENILSSKKYIWHWLIIILLFLMDGIITKNILEVLFPNIGTYELYVILVAFFVVVLSIAVTKLGAFYKRKSKYRWILTFVLSITFILLTLIRVLGIHELATDTLNPAASVGGVTKSNLLIAFLFFVIYILSGFVGAYFGYIDSYSDPIYLKPLETEYWQRKKVLSSIQSKIKDYEVRRNAYHEGWHKGIFILEKKKNKLKRKRSRGKSRWTKKFWNFVSKGQ